MEPVDTTKYEALYRAGLEAPRQKGVGGDRIEVRISDIEAWERIIERLKKEGCGRLKDSIDLEWASWYVGLKELRDTSYRWLTLDLLHGIMRRACRKHTRQVDYDHCRALADLTELASAPSAASAA
jgi:hypothetical protein